MLQAVQTRDLTITTTVQVFCGPVSGEQQICAEIGETRDTAGKLKQ